LGENPESGTSGREHKTGKPRSFRACEAMPLGYVLDHGRRFTNQSGDLGLLGSPRPWSYAPRGSDLLFGGPRSKSRRARRCDPPKGRQAEISKRVYCDALATELSVGPFCRRRSRIAGPVLRDELDAGRFQSAAHSPSLARVSEFCPLNRGKS
jgi:hypothetical protein